MQTWHAPHSALWPHVHLLHQVLHWFMRVSRRGGGVLAALCRARQSNSSRRPRRRGRPAGQLRPTRMPIVRPTCTAQRRKARIPRRFHTTPTPLSSKISSAPDVTVAVVPRGHVRGCVRDVGDGLLSRFTAFAHRPSRGSRSGSRCRDIGSAATCVCRSDKGCCSV